MRSFARHLFPHNAHRASFRWRAPCIGIIALCTTALLSLSFGAVHVGFFDIARIIGHHLVGLDTLLPHNTSPSAVHDVVIWELRVPRVVLAGCVGASLALAGATYQAVFRNPMADPYLLGSASGAGLGATLAIAYLRVQDLITPLAFLGAIGAVALTWFVSAKFHARHDMAITLLAGIAVSSFLTALQTFLLQRKTDVVARVYSWLLGQLTTAGWNDALHIFPSLVLVIIVLWWLAPHIDALALGDEKAHTLGVRVHTVRFISLASASLLTAVAVAATGLIGFIGLVVPHIVRRRITTRNRALFLYSALFGAVALMLADLAARTLVAPGELPVGVITAFFGAPFFLFILRTAEERER